MELDLNDPKLINALRRIKTENKSDPFIVATIIAHLRNGILDYEDVVGDKQQGKGGAS